MRYAQNIAKKNGQLKNAKNIQLKYLKLVLA